MEQYKGYTISEINPLYGTVTFTNGKVIKTGDVVGDISENDMRRIQIRETILSHFEKEENSLTRELNAYHYSSLMKLQNIVSMMKTEMKFFGEYGKIFEQNTSVF